MIRVGAENVGYTRGKDNEQKDDNDKELKNESRKSLEMIPADAQENGNRIGYDEGVGKCSLPGTPTSSRYIRSPVFVGVKEV